MTRIVVCGLCLLGIWMANVAPAWAQDHSSTGMADFTSGTAASAEQDWLRALAHFQKARDAGLAGPAVHYNIAVCHYRLGDYESANNVFSLIAERFPAMRALAQYNLGLVAQRRGDDEAAEAYFQEALENARDEKIQRLAAARLTPAPAQDISRWYSRLNTRIGYDDNVRLLADDVPLPEGQSTDSMLTEFWGTVSGPLSATPGFRFDGSLYSVRYQDASFYDQNYLSLGVVYRWQWGHWLTEAGPQLSLSTLDGNSYEDRGGIMVRVKRDLSSTVAFRARYSHDQIDAGDSQFAFVEGSRDWMELSLDHRDDGNRLTFSYAIESNDRGSNIASSRYRLALRYRYSFSARWLADLQASYRHSNYDELAQPREENLTELSVGVTRTLPREWEASGSVTLSNNSSVAPFSYDRTRFYLALSKHFY